MQNIFRSIFKRELKKSCCKLPHLNWVYVNAIILLLPLLIWFGLIHTTTVHGGSNKKQKPYSGTDQVAPVLGKIQIIYIIQFSDSRTQIS